MVPRNSECPFLNDGEGVDAAPIERVYLKISRTSFQSQHFHGVRPPCPLGFLENICSEVRPRGCVFILPNRSMGSMIWRALGNLSLTSHSQLKPCLRKLQLMQQARGGIIILVDSSY